MAKVLSATNNCLDDIFICVSTEDVFRNFIDCYRNEFLIAKDTAKSATERLLSRKTVYIQVCSKLSEDSPSVYAHRQLYKFAKDSWKVTSDNLRIARLRYKTAVAAYDKFKATHPELDMKKAIISC